MKLHRLTPGPGASQRTRNRLREHGPLFWTNGETRDTSFFVGPAVLVRSPDGWFGWLPLAQITLTPEPETPCPG